jgi:hypothetical protein
MALGRAGSLGVIAEMEISSTPGRRSNPSESLVGLSPIRWARTGLVVSFLALALAPLAVGDSYSALDNTLSESGGQGVAGAWVLRSGVLIAGAAVLTMTALDTPVWRDAARRWMRIYALALIMLVVFPESPWYEGAYDATVARLHTVAGVVGAVSFIIGVWMISRGRRQQAPARVFDWVVIAAIVIVPQAMLVLPGEGALQRLMVLLGYVWLFTESGRMSRHLARGDAWSRGRSGLAP